MYGANASCTVAIFSSVPQGSMLSPRLFILYAADLPDKIDEHGINFHANADDSQLYMYTVITAIQLQLLHYLNTALPTSVTANRLKLNAKTETELLWTSTKHSLSLLDGCSPSLCLVDDTIIPSKHVCVLVLTISSDLSLDKHVSNVCVADFSGFDNSVVFEGHLILTRL